MFKLNYCFFFFAKRARFISVKLDLDIHVACEQIMGYLWPKQSELLSLVACMCMMNGFCFKNL